MDAGRVSLPGDVHLIDVVGRIPLKERIIGVLSTTEQGAKRIAQPGQLFLLHWFCVENEKKAKQKRKVCYRLVRSLLLTTPRSVSSTEVAYCLLPFDKRSTRARGLRVARLKLELLLEELLALEAKKTERLEAGPRSRLLLADFKVAVLSIAGFFPFKGTQAAESTSTSVCFKQTVYYRSKGCTRV